ncbi:hypothetical protein LPJ61_002363 [Coemansia biformis]|uniref:HIT-type domain-containing protein n=1 Tax=Coemansia biformis TaxID=1286918 RepID=A0A9W8CWH8_9FUNG|nr:hypothetical protein LPJ61_002363 [Coemansia biformis]
MASKQCTACGGPAKYKCPACEAGYCSVGCCRAHRAEGCHPQAQTALPTAAAQPTASSQSASTLAPAATSSGEAEGEDDDDDEKKHRLRPEDLQRLDSSPRVRELLADPDLRALIEAVRRDPNPVQAIRTLRQQAGFEELVRALLGAASGEAGGLITSKR